MDDCVDWNDVAEELHTRLGFCGCGMPKEALTLINDLLEYIDYRSQPYKGTFSGPEWTQHCKDARDALDKIISNNPDGVKYVLFYLIADKNITAHGGSVPGWIEDHTFKNKLKSYIEHINS